MNGYDKDKVTDAGPEDFFAAARADDPGVSDELLQRIARDAAEMQPQAPSLAPVRAAKPKARIAIFPGNWQTAFALSFCLAVGVGLGLYPTTGLQEIGAQYGLSTVDFSAGDGIEEAMLIDDFWGEG